MTTPVPRLWPESTIACLGAGPSLTREDVDRLRGVVRVIAVNTSYQLAPWADALYACDEVWWFRETHRPGIDTFGGLKYSVDEFLIAARRRHHPPPRRPPGVEVLDNTGDTGIETQPTGLRTGRNSGYQAVNLAVHLGARRILLLGYDMKTSKDGRHHWHNDYRSTSAYDHFCQSFETTVEPLRTLGIEVLNCTRDTALRCFPRVPLESALEVPCLR